VAAWFASDRLLPVCMFDTVLFQIMTAGKCGRKCRCHFPEEPVPRKQSKCTVVSKQKTIGSLLDRKPGKELCWQKRNCVILVHEISPKKIIFKTKSVGVCFKNVCTKIHKIVETATV